MQVTDELRDKAISIMKKEGNYTKFKRLIRNGDTDRMLEMIMDVIKHHKLNDGNCIVEVTDKRM